jgi:hypothetical protein
MWNEGRRDRRPKSSDNGMRAWLVLAMLSGPAIGFSAVTPLDQPLPEDQVSMVEYAYERDEPALEQRYEVSIQKGTYHYRIYVPAGYYGSSSNRYPCLFIHSPGGDAQLDNVRDYAREKKWFVVMLVESRNGPDGPCIGNFLGAHDDVVGRFRIAEGRKVATGFSGGARMAGMSVGMRPGFSGLILQGAGFDYYQEGPKRGRYKYMSVQDHGEIVVYGLFGDKDSNRIEIELTKRQLPEKTIREFTTFAGGHEWAPPDAMRNALDWIVAQGVARPSGSAGPLESRQVASRDAENLCNPNDTR